MKCNKHWARLAEDVEMLPDHPKEARVMSPEEKEHLREVAATRPAWLVARCATILALNTTMRGCALKGLRWKRVDLFEKILVIRRQTTKSDAGVRVIPLNRDAILALAELHDRAEKIGSAAPEQYVFPACENNRIDPTRPMKGWRTAWRNLTGTPGLQGLRFHDLRHHAITELAEQPGTSDQTIMSIAGHVSREMLNHYSHIRLAAKRRALEALETPVADPSIPTEEAAPVTVN